MPAGEQGGGAVQTLGILAALDQPMLHRRRDQKADGGRHEKITARVQRAADRRDLLERVLEHAVELKAEENLAAEDQEARFIERRLDLVLERHGPVTR